MDVGRCQYSYQEENHSALFNVNISTYIQPEAGMYFQHENTPKPQSGARKPGRAQSRASSDFREIHSAIRAKICDRDQIITLRCIAVSATNN